MITGTFNLIVAQRLARMIAPERLMKINIKQLQPQLYANAIHALSTMSKELLAQEIQLRGIILQDYNAFVQE